MPTYEQDKIEENSSHPAEKMVHNALGEMHEARREVRQETLGGGVRRRTHLWFEATVVSAYDELRPYRVAAATIWSKHEIEKIHQITNRREPVDQTRNAGGVVQSSGDVEYRHVPVAVETLLELSHALDECAREIGFTINFGEEDVESPEPF